MVLTVGFDCISIVNLLKQRVLLVNIAGMYGTNVIVRIFLTIAYISKPTRNCHNNSQLGWDLVSNLVAHDTNHSY